MSKSQGQGYLGLELSGAKNQKTSVALLQFFPKENKIFVLDIFDRIGGNTHQNGDEALLELIEEIRPGVKSMGVNVPLTLPPCITCSPKQCRSWKGCSSPPVKWMNAFIRKIAKQRGTPLKSLEFTSYTQRPVELWVRHQILALLPEIYHFDIDEALGGSRAPLTARMHYLKKRILKLPLVEVWPKLSVAIFSKKLGIPFRIYSTYRQLEDGPYSREKILTGLMDSYSIFIYERDMRKLSQNLTAFDAFICGFTALLSDQNLCSKTPKGFPEASGWVQYPRVDAEP